MQLSETRLRGLFLVDLVRIADERGFFARSFCANEFRAAGITNTNFPQFNVSFNKQTGTLRGMHWQSRPKPEVKLVRCTRGAIYDVAIDLRPESPTFCQWYGAELNADNHRALYIPEGFAHGFQTLAPDSEVSYAMGEVFVGELARGVRWNDPAFAIQWPLATPILSPKDQAYPDFRP